MAAPTSSLTTSLKEPEPTNQTGTLIDSLPQLDPIVAKKLAREFALLVCSDNRLAEYNLNAILTDIGRPRPVNPFANVKQHAPKPPSKPLPCRLTTRRAWSSCSRCLLVSAAGRRIVLDQLGNIHGRRSTNHWDFVRFRPREGTADIEPHHAATSRLMGKNPSGECWRSSMANREGPGGTCTSM